jgi:hypothetical protein
MRHTDIGDAISLEGNVTIRSADAPGPEAEGYYVGVIDPGASLGKYWT